MTPTTLSLFSEFDTPQATGKTAVLVRSHLRHVKGSERLTAAPTDYVEQARQEDKRRAESRDTGLLALPPHNATATSKAAALAVQSQQATQLERVLQLITQAGTRGTTRADIAAKMGKPQSTIAARVSRLLEDGRVRETAEPRIPDCGGVVRQKVLVRV